MYALGKCESNSSAVWHKYCENLGIISVFYSFKRLAYSTTIDNLMNKKEKTNHKIWCGLAENCNALTLGPINLSARIDVMKTNRNRNTHPSTDANNQFRSFDNLLALKKFVNLYCGLAVHCSRNRVPMSSRIWTASSDNICNGVKHQSSVSKFIIRITGKSESLNKQVQQKATWDS